MRSDTVTKPTPAMRRAMAEAEVGDDVLDGDPTVRALEARVAELLGKERALFFPSGTMANQAAIAVHTHPAEEVLLDANAHIVNYEMAAAAALSMVQIRPVRGAGVVFDAAALRAAFRPAGAYLPRAGLVCLENTHNAAGGKVTPLDDLRALHAAALEHGVPVHLDGARLWNASVSSGTPLADFAACADTVMVSFSKGLGAPVGAALAGTGVSIRAADAIRKRLGGGMRQSGILAAGALHGLDEHFARLADDHAHARQFASMLAAVDGVRVVQPDTNIVMVDLPPGMTSAALVARAAREDVLLSAWLPTRIRAVTHLDVSGEMVASAAALLARLIEVEREAGDHGRGAIEPAVH